MAEPDPPPAPPPPPRQPTPRDAPMRTLGEGGGFHYEDASIPCPTPGCEGLGKVFRADAVRIPIACSKCLDELEAAREEEERVRVVEGLLDRAGGARMRPWTIDSYPADEQGREPLRVARAWLDAYPAVDDLFVHGPVGTGKSGLAWALVRALCERQVEAKLVNWRDYLWLLRESFRTREPPDRALFGVPVLALDDLGAERPTEFAAEELATLIEARTSSTRLRTIVTSNFPPSALAKRLGQHEPVVGQRIISRLTQHAQQLAVEGPDRRLA